MTIECNAKNPAEYFAGIGLIHVTGKPGRWDRACRALDIPDGEEAADRGIRVQSAAAFRDAPERLAWRPSDLPVELKWGALQCTLMPWTSVGRTSTTPSRLKTNAGRITGLYAARKLADLIAADEETRTWAEAFDSTSENSSSLFRCDGRSPAGKSAWLGFSIDGLKKQGAEDGAKVDVEIAIRPWVEMLACAGIHMTAARAPRYRIPHELTPPRATCAMDGLDTATEHRFERSADNPAESKYHSLR